MSNKVTVFLANTAISLFIITVLLWMFSIMFSLYTTSKIYLNLLSCVGQL